MKYLGHANARIDRAIAAKRKLIALLEEQKQAIINQAVTRGLDPHTSPSRSPASPGSADSRPLGKCSRQGTLPFRQAHAKTTAGDVCSLRKNLRVAMSHLTPASP